MFLFMAMCVSVGPFPLQLIAAKVGSDVTLNDGWGWVGNIKAKLQR